MKKSELKNLLKPMIKECIKEVIFEEGVLSSIVAEVVGGMGRPTLVESAPPQPARDEDRQARLQEQHAVVQRQKNDLLAAINKDAYGGVDLFEGTEPLSSGGTPGAGPSTQGPLSDIDPSDPGVDISSIVGMSGNRWAAHMK